MQARILTELQHSPTEALSATQTIDCVNVYSKDLEVLKKDNGKSWSLTIERAIAYAIVITVSCAVRLRFGKQTVYLDQNNHLVWVRKSGLECPLKADCTTVIIDVLDADKAIVKIRVPEAAQPISDEIVVTVAPKDEVKAPDSVEAAVPATTSPSDGVTQPLSLQ